MPFIDLQESQDRRLQMLLQTANQIQQNKIQRDQLSIQRSELALKDPSQNRFLRAEQATQNRERLAKAKYYEGGGRSSSGPTRMYEDPETGNLVPVLDSNGRPATIVELPSQKMDRKVAGATADQKNALQANQSAGIVFGELQRLSKGLESVGGYAGLALKGGNVITRGKLSPEVQAYKDFMPAASVSLYRGITGDTRLSDADAAARAYPLVWNVGEDGSVKGIKEKNVQNLLSARNLLLSNNIYATNKKDKITSLDDVAFVSNAINAGASESEIISFLKSRKK